VLISTPKLPRHYPVFLWGLIDNAVPCTVVNTAQWMRRYRVQSAARNARPVVERPPQKSARAAQTSGVVIAIETATAATCFDQRLKSTLLLPSTLPSLKTLHDTHTPTRNSANMAGDPRALLRQVGRTLELQPIGRSLISMWCNRQSSPCRRLRAASASLVDDKTNV
jgi:hypothetical protein